MIALPLLLAASAAGGVSIPPAFRAEWQSARTQCGEDQEHTLKISPRALRFYEATFEPRRSRRIDRGTLSLSGVWNEGGEATPATLHLTLSIDAKRLTVRTPWSTSRLLRC